MIVFNESEFGTTALGSNGFALSSRGDEVYLYSADANTNLTGYSHGVSFAASDPDVTFGRYVNSAGEEQFPAQFGPSFQAANTGPRVGPIVINEIHYHPVPGDDEFIEIKNISDSAVSFFDPAGNWRLNGAGFAFATNIVMPSQSYLLLVATNPVDFRVKYSVPESVPILGPYGGNLQDSGERLRLEHPAPPHTNGPAYVIIDEVRYNDRAPWSAAADGAGPSLQRKDGTQYGDDPINWDSAIATPGFANTTADSDGDGVPDAWEEAHGTLPGVADAHDDPDNDGRTNLEEFLAGTHPNHASSRFEIAVDATASVAFNSVVGRVYTLEYSSTLPAIWTDALAPTNGTGSVIVLSPRDVAGGFYRLRVERR
jgi:hypothetical protein